jgi:hypothetical protein
MDYLSDKLKDWTSKEDAVHFISVVLGITTEGSVVYSYDLDGILYPLLRYMIFKKVVLEDNNLDKVKWNKELNNA